LAGIRRSIPAATEAALWALSNGRCYAGTGPGVLRLPPAEASRLVAARLAVFGTEPPRNFADGGQPGPVQAVREFR